MAPSPLSRYVTAAVALRLADEGARVALVVLALERSGSAAVGGLLVAALMIPHVVAAPAIGLLTDRSRRPDIAIAVAAVVYAVALVATAVALGSVPTVVVVAVLLVGGSCGPAITGALTSRLPDLVAPDGLPRAFGLDSLSYNVAGIAGPALAAFIASVLDASTAAFTLAASLCLGSAVLLTLPGRPRPAPDSRDGLGLTSGVSAIVRDRVLGVVTTASTLGQLGPGALPVVAGVAAVQFGRPSDVGWLMAAVAAGGLLGSLLWTWRPLAVQRSPLVVMLSMIGLGLPLALAALTSHPVLLGVLFGLSGIFLGPFVGALFTARNEHAAPEVRAQVFTIGAGLKTTAAAAGAALVATITHLAVPVQFLIVACSPILAGLVGAVGLSAAHSRRTSHDEP